MVGKNIRKIISVMSTILEWTIFLVLIFIFLVVLSPLLPTKKYIYTYIVASGSMEPTIHTGSIALVKPVQSETLKKGDIITFTSPKNPKETILHRIFEVKHDNKGINFLTKGDNNNGQDMWIVSPILIKGQFIGSIPYLGHPAAFLKTKNGFILMVVVPAILLALLQIKTIKEGINEEVDRRTKRAVEAMNNKNPMKNIIIFAIILNGFIYYGAHNYVKALFISKATVSGVSFSVIDFIPPSIPTGLRYNNPNVACAGATASNTITADWDNSIAHGSKYIDHYEFESYNPPTGLILGPVSTTTSDYSDSFTVGEGTYGFRVRAVDSLGYKSDWTSQCSIIYDTTAPIISNISSILATPLNENEPQATVTWNTNENATSNVEYSMDAGATWSPLLPEDTTADNASHSREITGLSTTTTYTYHVKSKDSAGNEATSSDKSFTTGNMNISTAATSDIVINEFLPDPTGADNALMPNGEWIELYNRGITTFNLTGWSISTDSSIPAYKMPLTLTNTVTSDSGTTGLNMAPGEFFTVYRNGDPNFSLNHAGDTVYLFDNTGIEIDSHTYSVGEVAENKSIARFPDGTDTWFDPIPTADGPNKLEAILQSTNVTPTPTIIPTPTVTMTPTPIASPEAALHLSDEKKSITIKAVNLVGFAKLSYKLTYSAYSSDKGIIGNDVDITGKTEYEKQIDLATCSSGDCTYDQDVKNFILKITLEDKDGKKTEIVTSL